MPWEVEFTDEFNLWWESLTWDEQARISAAVRHLEERGPSLGFPFTSGVVTSRHSQMRELRVQVEGRPIRILYAFDPRREALLLWAGTRLETTVGTSRSCPSPISSSTSTWRS